MSTGRVQVLFSDSGPGVREEIRDGIFEPWVTDKPNGIGLGLTIAGEAAVEHDAELSLAADGPLQGATFQMVFRTPEGYFIRLRVTQFGLELGGNTARGAVESIFCRGRPGPPRYHEEPNRINGSS